MTIEWSDFEKIEIRIGTIINAEVAVGTNKPAYRLMVDFGEFGVKTSSAQITKTYDAQSLVGTQVSAVVNFKPKQIGKFVSECLILGAVSENSDVILLRPERHVFNGLRVS